MNKGESKNFHMPRSGRKGEILPLIDGKNIELPTLSQEIINETQKIRKDLYIDTMKLVGDKLDFVGKIIERIDRIIGELYLTYEKRRIKKPYELILCYKELNRYFNNIRSYYILLTNDKQNLDSISFQFSFNLPDFNFKGINGKIFEVLIGCKEELDKISLLLGQVQNDIEYCNIYGAKIQRLLTLKVLYENRFSQGKYDKEIVKPKGLGEICGLIKNEMDENGIDISITAIKEILYSLKKIGLVDKHKIKKYRKQPKKRIEQLSFKKKDGTKVRQGAKKHIYFLTESGSKYFHGIKWDLYWFSKSSAS
ncbi:MAG: hypothetical protein CO092_01455 [Candidatus Aenigmarchaeota archaeon CG_4_9_14_3_um_filter_37_18]|nr:MAG: hypothetical protein COW21_00045 [Candidatus Aenigmarchaeota archaeon CG15_BIG_FIL_POST_REV_8_21_14_020_37_27]PJB75587.1 MAG: hypothetical protein CO092_01455 [Candidatus Aenigmarchaeota archaeon CG_4_9_14_3_um_filter_37_18]